MAGNRHKTFRIAAMNSAFSPQAYSDLLAALLARGYAVRDFATAQPDRADLILRHDVDVWPGYALPMAEAEAALGVSASYFVLTTSPLYNVGAADCRSALARLLQLGHRVDLHFDPAAYPADADRDAAAARECDWLQAITGQPVGMVSFHRPSPDLLNNPATLAGRPHAYQPRYFSAMGYCSDSRGGWHKGAPLQHAAVAAGTALQLLTHPIWWLGDGTPQAALERYLSDRIAGLDAALAANVTTHHPGRIAVTFKGEA